MNKSRWLYAGTGVVATVVSSFAIARHVRQKRAALALAHAAAPAIAGLVQAGRAADAARVRSHCARDACGCVVTAGMALLDLDRAADVDALVEAAPACKETPLVLGLRAEQAAEQQLPEVARLLADRAIVAQAKNACALMARARLAFAGSHIDDTRDAAKKALEYGRGVEAERFIARADLAQGKLESARAHFLKLAERAPRDLEALFTAAVCADKLGKFHDAREGYLQVLRLDRRHAQARYYLGLLTLRHGAVAEARHDAEELSKIVPPGDKRLVALQQLLSSSAPAPDGAFAQVH